MIEEMYIYLIKKSDIAVLCSFLKLKYHHAYLTLPLIYIEADSALGLRFRSHVVYDKEKKKNDR